MKIHKHKHVTLDGTEINLEVKSKGFDWGNVIAVLFFAWLAAMTIAGIMEAPAAGSVSIHQVKAPGEPIPWGTVIGTILAGVVGIMMMAIGALSLMVAIKQRNERKQERPELGTYVGVPLELPEKRRTDDMPAQPGKVVPLRRVS